MTVNENVINLSTNDISQFLGNNEKYLITEMVKIELSNKIKNYNGNDAIKN